MVKPGYKQTEIGIIPYDWKCTPIGSFATVCMCKRIFAGQTSENGEIPFFKIGTFGKKADAYISRALFDEYKSKFSYPAVGDILISAAATLGRTVVFDGKDAYFQDSNIVWLDIDEDEICNDYLYHYYKVIKWVPSEGSTISRLYNGIITSTWMAYPELAEQKRIAAVLSDIDAMITNLEKLIAKKKAIKQGAMQELLTGKRRLPGFEGEWEDTCIGKICTLISGGTPSTSVSEYWDGGIPWCTPTDITGCNGKYLHKTTDTISSLGLSNSAATMLPVGALLLCTRATIGAVKIARTPICTNQGFKSLVVKDCTDNEWLYYAIQMYKTEMIAQAIGSTFLEISKKALSNIQIRLPEKAEQKAIATVLSDMDAEIEALVIKIEKARRIREGMMSELLTGRIRLI